MAAAVVAVRRARKTSRPERIPSTTTFCPHADDADSSYLLKFSLFKKGDIRTKQKNTVIHVFLQGTPFRKSNSFFTRPKRQTFTRCLASSSMTEPRHPSGHRSLRLHRWNPAEVVPVPGISTCSCGDGDRGPVIRAECAFNPPQCSPHGSPPGAAARRTPPFLRRNPSGTRDGRERSARTHTRAHGFRAS